MKHHTGIVALLDALGARTMHLDGSRHYAKSIHNLRKYIHYANRHCAAGRGLINDEHLTVSLFGDSVLLTLPVEKPELEYLAALRMCWIVSNFISEGIQNKILFRGALSIGEYIFEEKDKDTIAIGPAITDAANWYEELQGIGAFFTPYSTSIMNALLDRNKYEYNKSWLDVIRFKPLLKTEYKDELLMLNWPVLAFMSAINEDPGLDDMDPLTWYSLQMRSFPIPKGQEHKYLAAKEFFQAATNSPDWETMIQTMKEARDESKKDKSSPAM